METKQLKLETYLFCTDFLFGISVIVSGIIGLFSNKSIVVDISHLIVTLVILLVLIKSISLPSEDFDELSCKIKNSVDSRILCISMPVIVIFCDIIYTLDRFNISINFPLYSIVEIFMGILFCLQYIVFVIKIKTISDFDGEEDA